MNDSVPFLCRSARLSIFKNAHKFWRRAFIGIKFVVRLKLTYLNDLCFLREEKEEEEYNE